MRWIVSVDERVLAVVILMLKVRVFSRKCEIVLEVDYGTDERYGDAVGQTW